MDIESLFSDALQLPISAVGYHISQRLGTQFPGKTVLQVGAGYFQVEEYARAGGCTLTPRATPHAETRSAWHGPGQGAATRAINTWYGVAWEGEDLDVLVLHWGNDNSPELCYFILAATSELAERFLVTVSEWNMGLREEVLVFDGYRWAKSGSLFQDIQGATLDNLVLRGNLKREIHDDLASFFAARQTYERYGVPWKRGILFVGPPGNGKTHAVKAIINALAKPCLYVKSFPQEGAIRAVFAQARLSAPCILVLEDLDALVRPDNRSVLLNEMDGFAANNGILTLATTNHPERLDPAIVDRPSRFDRKYPFDLPAFAERLAYIRQWNNTLQPALRLSEEAAAHTAEHTEGFSFAYLKELFLSATMRWMATPVPGAMDGVAREQLEVLRDHMVSARP